MHWEQVPREEKVRVAVDCFVAQRAAADVKERPGCAYGVIAVRRFRRIAPDGPALARLPVVVPLVL